MPAALESLGLSRDVTVLPEAVAAEPERLARFEREARERAGYGHGASRG